MSPRDFAKNPVRWLELVDRHRAEFSCAPDYAYELCSRRLTADQVRGLDLSCWKHAGASADSADLDVLDAFTATLAPAGFRPESVRRSYSLPEATLFVTGTRPATAPTVVRVDAGALEQDSFRPVPDGTPGLPMVGSGNVFGLDVRIVDPVTAVPSPPGAIGEVWIRGDSVAAGYWRRPAETSRAFGAVTADGEVGFLRTGELGVFHGGELFLTGHLQDVLDVQGRTLYPHDLERAAGTVDALARLTGTVFAVPGSGQRIVVLHEVAERAVRTAGLGTIARQLKMLIGLRFGVHDVQVVLVRAGTLRRTGTSENRRAMVRELFLASALDPVYNDLEPDGASMPAQAALVGVAGGAA